jgi:L-ribulokinase
MAYTLGIDYGTNSVRALVVDCANGHEAGSCVVPYPSGQNGILLQRGDSYLARQNPGDYLFGLERSVLGALEQAARTPSFSRDQVIGIGVDTTGSSPLPVDAHNVPLALNAKWKDHLAAQCWLWKDHTSHREAAEITRLAAKHRPQYLAKCGGVYSSEWFWSKIWHCLNTSPEVFEAADSWVELCDFIPSVLAGRVERASRQGIPGPARSPPGRTARPIVRTGP